MSRRVGATTAAGVLLLSLVLTGCTQARPLPTTPPTASPSPTATAAGFDGSCPAVATDQQVLTALGATGGINTTLTPRRSDPGMAALGGLACVWTTGDQTQPGEGQLVLQVLPVAAAAAGDITQSEAGTPACDTGSDLSASNSGCRFAGTVDGWWYWALMFTGVTASAQQAAVPRVRAAVESALRSRAAPTPPAAQEPVTCGAVDAALRSAGVTSISGATVSTDSGPDPRGGLPVVDAARRLGQTGCTWNGTDLGFLIAPHSGAYFDQCSRMAGASIVTVAGVAHAVTLPAEDGASTLCATDGTSTVTTSSPDGGTGWDAAALEAAGVTLPAVLRVASSSAG